MLVISATGSFEEVGQLQIITRVGKDLLQSGAENLLRSWAIIIAKWDNFITKWGSHYKMGDNYYNVSQYQVFK